MHNNRNVKPASIITLDIIVDMYEWSDGCLGTKSEDAAYSRVIAIAPRDFGELLDYLGKRRKKIIQYRGCIVACYPVMPQHPLLKFLGKM